jgi:glycosyltransferase involved in cell wall biosynthesis
VILSRGRSKLISTYKIIKDPIVVVPQSEYEAYKKSTGLTSIIRIPDKIKGLAKVRNWALDHFRERVVVMLDDDITKVWCISHEKGYNITDPATINQIIDNTARCCIEAGARVFGFNQAWDVRKFKANNPFKLTGWIGGVIGVVGRRLRFDETNKLRVDVDFCLQNMLENRIIWKEDRFSFVQQRFSNVGGNSIFRTADADKTERDYLKRKWGAYVIFAKTKVGITIKTEVPRKIHSDRLKIS